MQEFGSHHIEVMLNNVKLDSVENFRPRFESNLVWIVSFPLSLR
jgi:hypothetical protein